MVEPTSQDKVPYFRLDGKTLHLNAETKDLSAFLWKIPTNDTTPGMKKITTFLVFDDHEIHVIQLEPEKGEKPFKSVASLTQKKRVQILSDDDIKMFLAESDLSTEDMERILAAASQ